MKYLKYIKSSLKVTGAFFIEIFMTFGCHLVRGTLVLIACVIIVFVKLNITHVRITKKMKYFSRSERFLFCFDNVSDTKPSSSHFVVVMAKMSDWWTQDIKVVPN